MKDFPTGWCAGGLGLASFLLGWGIAGCGPHQGPKPFPDVPYQPIPPTVPGLVETSPGHWQQGPIPTGAQTSSPEASDWVDPRYATWPVDRITAAQQRWIPEGTVGPPPGWTILVVEGDGFYSPEVDRRVFGLTFYWSKTIYVSRWAATVPGGHRHGGELPALRWELANAWLGEAGHPEEAY